MQEFQEAINGIYAHILVVTLYMLPRGKSGKKKKKKSHSDYFLYLHTCLQTQKRGSQPDHVWYHNQNQAPGKLSKRTDTVTLTMDNIRQ